MKWKLVTQSCPTLCDSMDCSPLCPWDSTGKNTGMVCHFLLQGISSIQGSNLALSALQEDFLLSESPGFGTLSWGKRRPWFRVGWSEFQICHFLARNVILEKVFSRSQFVHLWSGETATLFSLSVSIYHVLQMMYEKCFSEVFVLKECTLGKAKYVIQSKYYVLRWGLSTGSLPVFLFHCIKCRHWTRWSLRGL